MLELAILGLLKESELHGYELKKRLSETLGPFSSVSFGSLYPALARLESAGAVKAVEANDVVPPAGGARLGPMTGSLSGELAAFRARRATREGQRMPRAGRGKKVYAITERGEQLFEELLAADGSPEDERAFNLRLAFASYLGADQRLGMLERRRAQLIERLAQARVAVRSGRARLDAYSHSLMEHSTENAERDISWLDRLIATERANRPAPEAEPPVPTTEDH